MSAPPLTKRRSVFGVYAAHTLRHPWLFFTIVVCGLIMQATYLVAPLYLREFINILATGTPTEAAVHSLFIILTTIVVVWFVDWVAHRIQYVATMYLELRVMKGLYRSSFDYLLGHSYNFFVSQFAGSLTHRLSRFSKVYEMLFDALINNFAPTLLFIGGAIVILFIRNHTLGTILAVWAVLFFSFQVYVARMRQPIRTARAAAESRITGNLADAISNQSTVTLFSGGKHEAMRFFATVQEWAALAKRAWLADAWIWMGIGLLMIAVQTALLYVGIELWQQGLFTAGDFILIQAYLITAFQRLEKINRDLRRVHDAYSDAQEMIDILDTPHEVQDIEGAKPLSVSSGQIEFKDVSFYYHADHNIFDHFNLPIRPGEKVALVGKSGAGKSTIIKLILRLFDVKNGSIEIDEQNIAAVMQESLRDSIAFVPQEPILFHRTLMENIRYGRRDATDEEVVEASKGARCHEFIESLPHQYGTYVGERGIKLSGGERQRVAIARAILKNAPILILDEATSSLDSTSELLIQDALSELMQGKTVIVIAHRLSTVMKMDRIVVLEKGKIIEEGMHKELLNKQGRYAELWNHQIGGFMVDE